MKEVGKIGKGIFPSDTEEIAKILENLDKKSIVLAGVYLKVLTDRQKIEETMQDSNISN